MEHDSSPSTSPLEVLGGAADADPVRKGGCDILRERQPPVLTGAPGAGRREKGD